MNARRTPTWLCETLRFITQRRRSHLQQSGVPGLGTLNGVALLSAKTSNARPCGLIPFRLNLHLCYMYAMRGLKRPALLSWLRLNNAAIMAAFLAVLANVFVAIGWMPASAQGDGLSMIICTSMGPSQVAIGADEQPTPHQGQTHDHQCCPCGSGRNVAPPVNALALLILPNTEPPIIVWAPVEAPFVSFVLTPHSPRAPPVLV